MGNSRCQFFFYPLSERKGDETVATGFGRVAMYDR